MTKKKKPYQPPTVGKVSLEIKTSVLGIGCYTSTNTAATPVCDLPGASCATPSP
jgi:hypothetical protein